MTDTEFTKVCTAMRQDIADRTPYLTGNLANNATLVRSTGLNEIRVYVDENIAPYFKYVNGRPSYRVNSQFKGGKVLKYNRNYMYFERAFVKAVENLANRIDGEIIRID